ncbi:MAG: dynamin family protein [Sulfurimonadaceae bacterium]
MRHLKAFVREYKEQFVEEEHFDTSITGQIKSVQRALLDERFHPSVQLKVLFDKLLRRSKYPMEVAIVGQFSSGKSTFLNALLSKDVLPTGITPVTSKVNYINYADEYKLKVTYKNGAEEYHALERISRFTDQRESVEDIKYLTLYAPMDILRDISFVDTPGLNSQSLGDTQSTKKILRDVDGIIWLTLIDNAGKESEAEVLEEYLENFKEKSLCVLNQKDKFSAEQIETTLAYITAKFSPFFAEVVPISAKQALESRVHQKEVLRDNALLELQNSFKALSASHTQDEDLGFFNKEYERFHKTIQKIEEADNSNNLTLMQESNISQVLEFIEGTIRPQAREAKAYAIKKDLSSLCDILLGEYETILGVYESLEKILRHNEDKILRAFDKVYLKHSQSLYTTYDKIEMVLETIAQSIYENIKTRQETRYQEEKGILGQKQIKPYEYEALYVDQEAIMQKLFYESQYIDKQIKAVIGYFKNIETDSSEDLRDVFRILKNAVQVWQEPYEHINKHREIASDLEFANTRQFVAKVYENVLLAYHRSILGNISDVHKQFAFFDGNLSSSYKQLSHESIFMVKEKIDKQIKMYINDPLKYTINGPSYESILEIVKNNFSFEKTEAFLSSRRNYLYKIIESSKAQFEEINSDRIDYIVSNKQGVIGKIEGIEKVKGSIEGE